MNIDINIYIYIKMYICTDIPHMCKVIRIYLNVNIYIYIYDYICTLHIIVLNNRRKF